MKKTVIWSPEARIDIRSVDQRVAMRIFDAIDRYVSGGTCNIKRLQWPLEGYRLRVGDWRVIFVPHPPAGIHIVRVQHRREAYR